MFRYVALGIAFLVAGCGKDNNPQVEIVTNKGKIKVELFERQAPITVKNFLHYVDTKHYDGTIFHRVIPGFMIQGGGFKPGMAREEPTEAPIKNEATNGLSNTVGTLAMARTDDPDSATAQFFINVVDNANLDRAKAPDKHGYAVFGQVVSGMDVVNKIRYVPRKTVYDDKDRPMHRDVPVDDVIIESVRRIEK